MPIRELTVTALLLAPLVAAAPDTGRAEDPAASPAYEQARGDTLDAYIAGRLITAYALSEHLAPYPLSVQVNAGIVKLDGEVPNLVLRELALEIARGVEGVKDIRVEIGVNPALAEPSPAGDSSFVRRFGDATITARVKTRLLWNGSTNGLSINVDTRDEIVTLSGSVSSAAERALAEQIAINTDGVRRVDNQLNVGRVAAARSG